MKSSLLHLLLIGLFLISCKSTQEPLSKQSNDECPDRTFREVKLPSYYDALGVIIPKDYYRDYMDTLRDSTKRFTPALEEIRKAEEILHDQYNRFHQSIPSSDDFFKPLKDVKKYLKDFPRQYYGYYQDNGDRIITINVLEIDDASKQREYIEHWRCDAIAVIIEFGGGTISYNVNIDSDKLFM
jgi:hypothetical protein